MFVTCFGVGVVRNKLPVKYVLSLAGDFHYLRSCSSNIRFLTKSL